MCDVLYKYSVALLVTPDSFDYNDKERWLEVDRVLYSQSTEAGPPSPVTLKPAGSRSCAQRTPRSGAQPRAHCPLDVREWGSRAAQASLRRPQSPGLMILNGGHAPPAVASHCCSRGLVWVTPGESLPLAFRTSILSPAGRTRTLLGLPSSPGRL